MKINNLFSSLKISGAGLSAQRKKLDAISSNLANVDTTKTIDGGPYKRQIVKISNGQDRSEFNEVLINTKSELWLTHKNHLDERLNFLEDEGIKIPKVDIVEDNSEPRLEYDPSHPDANADGYVAKPNVNLISEMVDMVTATRAFEANSTAINAAKNMYRDALEI